MCDFRYCRASEVLNIRWSRVGFAKGIGMPPTNFNYRMLMLAGLASVAIGLALRNVAVWLMGVALFIVGAGGARRTPQPGKGGNDGLDARHYRRCSPA